MRKSSFELTLGSFNTSLDWDIRFLMKIEAASRVVRSAREKRSVFKAFVFSICANWEIFVEELLLDCLNQDTSRYAEFTGYALPKHISIGLCKAVVVGVGYTDFKSVGHLKQISRQMLVPRRNPFVKITTPNGNKIDEFFIMRNYLAHYSYAARRSLLKVYQGVYSMKRFVEPGVFLLARDKEEQIPRMGMYINNFNQTANRMGKFLGVPWV